MPSRKNPGGRQGGNPESGVSKGRGRKKKTITDQQEVFKKAFLANPTNATEAARKAGYRNPTTMGVKLRDPKYYPRLAAQIEQGLRRQEERAEIKGTDLLRHIHTVINVNLAQWFLPGDNGGWLIEEDGLKSLPPEIGKLIESIERREISLPGPGGKLVKKTTFWVRIVSKTKALELAAKYQLGERHEVVFTTVNWDAMYQRTLDRPDPLARRLEVLATEARELPPAGVRDEGENNDNDNDLGDTAHTDGAGPS